MCMSDSDCWNICHCMNIMIVGVLTVLGVNLTVDIQVWTPWLFPLQYGCLLSPICGHEISKPLPMKSENFLQTQQGGQALSLTNEKDSVNLI